MNQRKHLTAEKKMMILREYLENKVPIGELAEKHHVSVNDIYRWKKRLFEGGINLLTSQVGKKQSKDEERIKRLEEKLRQREAVITEIVQDNIELKKNLNGNH
jgi:transposase